ncbi:MAG: HD domain-containing protein [Phycisphaerae bacterium]|nr:HD domain-containing protein [Phycisphaerae bacterium]
MSRRYIKDLASGDTLDDQVFLLTQKDLRSANNGSLYIHAVLADRTGQMPGRVWQASQELYNLLPQDGFVKVRGRTESYKGSLQFIIEGIKAVDVSAADVEELLPKTAKDIDQMKRRVLEILRMVKDRNVLYLVKQFVDDKKLMEQFCKAPAAVQMHHACIGGLLEHTLNLMELVLLVGPRYPQIDMDLMIAGTFLHDIGKTHELTCEGAFKYSDGGQLVGHLVIGALFIEQKARLAEKELGEPFPERILHLLQHMVLSHHGEYELGAARLPMTAESLALHHLDNLDAKLEMVRLEIESANATDPETSWTGYVRSLERRLYKGGLYGKAGKDGDRSGS